MKEFFLVSREAKEKKKSSVSSVKIGKDNLYMNKSHSIIMRKKLRVLRKIRID